VLTELGKKFREIIIDGWKGMPFYIGGDDLTAFGPAEGALKTSIELHRVFVDAFEDAAKRFEGIEDINATCSIGLVYADCLDPAGLMIEEALNALNKAKEEYGRDALVVSSKVKSGSFIQTGGKFGLMDKLLRDLIIVHRKPDIINAEPLVSNVSTSWLRDVESNLDNYYPYKMDEIKWQVWRDQYPAGMEDTLWIEMLRLWDRHTKQGFKVRDVSQKEWWNDFESAMKAFFSGSGIEQITRLPAEMRGLEQCKQNMMGLFDTVLFLSRILDSKEDI